MTTRFRPSTSEEFDADTILVTLSNGAELALYAFIGRDGVPVVQIDENDSDHPTGRLRINLNDGPVWDGSSEDEHPGAFFSTN